MLPADVRVRSVTPAAPGFDARFSALSRSYRYRIATAEWGAAPADRRLRARLAPTAGRAGHAGRRRRAARAARLRRLLPAAARATTVRDLQASTWPRRADEVHVDVTADAFCHSMVRALVGSLLAVGDGRVPVGRPAALLAARERTAAISVAPAHGLTLLDVDYPADAELAARAAQTRAVRAGDDAPYLRCRYLQDFSSSASAGIRRGDGAAARPTASSDRDESGGGPARGCRVT